MCLIQLSRDEQIQIWLSLEDYVEQQKMFYESTLRTKSIKVPKNTLFLVYLEVGTLASDMATLAFNTKGAFQDRKWQIKQIQIPCSSAAA